MFRASSHFNDPVKVPRPLTWICFEIPPNVQRPPFTIVSVMAI